MDHPAKPDDHAHLRSIINRLNSDSWSGWYGGDIPYVEGEDIDEMLDELDRRAQDRLEEYQEREEFTQPSRKRREARQKAEYRIERGETTW